MQGIGAALLVPGSLAIISASFQRSERGRAIGTWSGVLRASRRRSGPVLGGWLIDARVVALVFFVNVPIAAAVLAIARAARAREPRRSRGLGVDWPARCSRRRASAAIVYGAHRAATPEGWRQPAVLGALLGGALILALFVSLEARAAAPMVPLELFRSRAFAAPTCSRSSCMPPWAGPVLPAVQPDPGAGLLGDAGGRGAAALHPADVRAVALVRRAGGPVGARTPLVDRPR